MIKCEICENDLAIRWTDTHGIGACITCGTPYKIYHYDENNKRVDKSAENLILPEWISLMKQYWNENKRNCDPGAFNFPGSNYEVATKEDFEIYNKWMEKHKNEWPEIVS